MWGLVDVATFRTNLTDGPALADDWLALLHDARADFTLAWRRLAEAAAGNQALLRPLHGAHALHLDNRNRLKRSKSLIFDLSILDVNCHQCRDKRQSNLSRS